MAGFSKLTRMYRKTPFGKDSRATAPPRRTTASPWRGTLAIAAALAVIVAAAGSLLSRQVERISERPAGNRIDDVFREMARRVDELEGLWETALEDEAKLLLTNGFRLPEDGGMAAGVVQRSLLNPSLSDPARAHLRNDRSPPEWRPVLKRFARNDPGEWVLEEAEILHGAGWRREPGRPAAWWQGNGNRAVVLLLDVPEAATIAGKDLIRHMAAVGAMDLPGAWSWTGPDGRVWLPSRAVAPETAPDEILRHVSHFGDWTLRQWYPVRTEVTYRAPVLAGSFTIAALLLAGGVAAASGQRKAIRHAEERVSFVNRVSHELRTPLTNLLLNTDLALDGLPVGDSKARRRLGLIREETSRLGRIVENVLAFASIERGHSSVRRTACDVGKVVEELRENFAPLFGRKSIRCDYDNQLEETVAMDRDALAQILSNLLSNVEKYAGESARARLAVARENDCLVVTVEDDGPGIPDDARKRIFQPFERADLRVDQGASGTGLGLAISRELAERLGGRLELLSGKQGARFRLCLPLEERSEP